MKSNTYSQPYRFNQALLESNIGVRTVWEYAVLESKWTRRKLCFVPKAASLDAAQSNALHLLPYCLHNVYGILLARRGLKSGLWYSWSRQIWECFEIQHARELLANEGGALKAYWALQAILGWSWRAGIRPSTSVRTIGPDSSLEARNTFYNSKRSRKTQPTPTGPARDRGSALGYNCLRPAERRAHIAA